MNFLPTVLKRMWSNMSLPPRLKVSVEKRRGQAIKQAHNGKYYEFAWCMCYHVRVADDSSPERGDSPPQLRLRANAGKSCQTTKQAHSARGKYNLQW